MNDLYYDELLLDICHKRMNEIYGNAIPEEAKIRFYEEFGTVRMKKKAFLLIAFSNAVKKIGGDKRTLSSLYGWSSYITYLLGLNLFNPLDRQLMNGHICDVEYAKSELSGWYAMAYYTTPDMLDEIVANMENEENINKVNRVYYPVFAEEEQCTYDIITESKSGKYSDSFEIDFKKDKRLEFIDFITGITETDPSAVLYNDKRVFNFIIDNAENSFFKNDIYMFEDGRIFDDIIKTVKPTDFYQLSKAVGLYESIGAWCDEAKNGFLSGAVDIDKVIATRNDAFDYFKAKLGDSKKAYFASTMVSRGQSFVGSEFEKYANNVEIRRIKYLQKRAGTLYDARIVCTLAYYKMNFLEEFDFAYSKYMDK